MGALDFSLSQGRTAQLLQTQQLPNSAILQPKQINLPQQQDLCIMDFDPNGYLDNAYLNNYTAFAIDCKHYVPASSAPTIQPSLSASTLDDDSDWEDAYPPPSSAPAPSTIFLCKNCEQAIRTELNDARVAYTALWACGPDDQAKDDEQVSRVSYATRAASQRYVKASIKVANFESRMADRDNNTKAREQKWLAEKKVRFTVEEGKGAGEKPKQKKEKVSAIALGWVEVDTPTASPSTSPDEDASYVFTYKPSIFTYHGDDDEGY
jgi:hypothetical protein